MASETTYYQDVVEQLLQDYKAGLQDHKASGNLLSSLSTNIIQDGSKFEF